MLLLVLLLPGENGLVITVLKAIISLSNDKKNRLQIIVAILSVSIVNHSAQWDTSFMEYFITKCSSSQGICVK